MGERRLIINADDFGLTPGVTRGIVEAMAHGVVTSASVMVNMPGWDDAAERLRDASDDGAYGLHLNLVAGRPLTDAPSLVDRRTGAFHTISQFVLRAVAGALHHDDIATECAAQLERLRSTGIRVTHADSHRHVHVLPIVASAIAPVVAGLPLRRPNEALTRNPGALGASIKKLVVLAALGGRTQAGQRDRAADHFVGLSLQGSPRFGERLAQLVSTLPNGTTELMVHPGYADSSLAEVDEYTKPREHELRSLMAPAWRTRLRSAGVTLTRFEAPLPFAPHAQDLTQ